MLLFPILVSVILTADKPPVPVVILEEDVYTFVPPNNGSGPLWSYGCTQIARDGEEVYVSQMETGEGVPRLCNTRWRILRRDEKGWTALAEADGFRQREPCPLGIIGSMLFLNVNESMRNPGAVYEPCRPHLFKFNFRTTPIQISTIQPEWPGKPYFTDHSYRGYAVDRERSELLMMNVDNATTLDQVWCHLSVAGATLKSGTIHFPIRGCYSQIALVNRAAYIMAISDIVEPVEEWRNFKKEKTGADWDFVFRVLNFTWTPDISKEPFAPLVEVANVEATGGHIGNQDLWIAPDGRAYVLYTQREVQSALLRDEFMPGKSILSDLCLAIVKDGKVIERHVLIQGSEEAQGGHARFQATADGRVFAVIHRTGQETRNELMPIYPEVQPDAAVPIPVLKPFYGFCLASVRAGNLPSNTMDLFGFCKDATTLSYARIEIK